MGHEWASDELITKDALNESGASLTQAVRDARNWNGGDLTTDSDDNDFLKRYGGADSTSVAASWRMVDNIEHLTTAERTSLTPPPYWFVFDTDEEKLYYYDSGWVLFASAGGGGGGSAAAQILAHDYLDYSTYSVFVLAGARFQTVASLGAFAAGNTFLYLHTSHQGGNNQTTPTQILSNTDQRAALHGVVIPQSGVRRMTGFCIPFESTNGSNMVTMYRANSASHAQSIWSITNTILGLPLQTAMNFETNYATGGSSVGATTDIISTSSTLTVASGNKVLVIGSMMLAASTGTPTLVLRRDTTDISANYGVNWSAQGDHNPGIVYLDTPSAGSYTYRLRNSGGTVMTPRSQTIIAIEIDQNVESGMTTGSGSSTFTVTLPSITQDSRVLVIASIEYTSNGASTTSIANAGIAIEGTKVFGAEWNLTAAGQGSTSATGATILHALSDPLDSGSRTFDLITSASGGGSINDVSIVAIEILAS